MLLNKENVHLTRPTPALTPVYLTSRRGVDTEDGSLASDHDYHIVICSVTRGLVQRPGRLWTPCVMLPTNPAPYTIVEWGIQTARYNVSYFLRLIEACPTRRSHKKHIVYHSVAWEYCTCPCQGQAVLTHTVQPTDHT